MSFALFGNLGAPELLIILFVALLLFGGRLPDVARSLGRSFTQFKRGLKDVEDEVESAGRELDSGSSGQLPKDGKRPEAERSQAPKTES